jgi:cytochrome c1
MKLPSVPVRFLSLLIVAFAVRASDLPEGKGKDAVENTCADCHSLDRIKTQHLNEEGWNSIIHEMIENGASINSDDVKIIVDYLTKNFGPDKAGKSDRPRR